MNNPDFDPVREMTETGLCVIREGVKPELVDAALLEIDTFKTANLSWLTGGNLLIEGMLSRVINLHLLLPALRDVFRALRPEAVAAAETIGPAALYTSLYFERGSQQGLHRDTPYFWTTPPYAYAGVWVALEDADERNGALIAVPRSHLLGEPDLEALRRLWLGEAECPPSHGPLFDAYNLAVNRLSEAAGLKTKLLEVRKGDVVVWNGSTLHGGSRIIDQSRTRKSFVMHVTPPGTPVGHMQYFFHPEKPPLAKAPWGFFEEGGKWFADHRRISVMHQFDAAVEDFDAGFRFNGVT